jgi:metal-dependent amidase/aminoacylase/carboxypeptidase family protein
VREQVKARVNDIAAGLARAFDAHITVHWYEGPSALVNDERWAAFTRDVADWHGYDTQVAQLHMGGKILPSTSNIFPAHSSVLAAPVNMACTIRRLIPTKH